MGLIKRLLSTDRSLFLQSMIKLIQERNKDTLSLKLALTALNNNILIVNPKLLTTTLQSFSLVRVEKKIISFSLVQLSTCKYCKEDLMLYQLGDSLVCLVFLFLLFQDCCNRHTSTLQWPQNIVCHHSYHPACTEEHLCLQPRHLFGN